mmetsp:Transcript_26887/g.68099  ORF Transcript_26887/g.68099 Transcript_26887/m.68099 type:complete len:316 (-) Transcript_26887:682-1629(-)
MALSKSAWQMRVPLLRTMRMAASLQIAASSAPDSPGTSSATLPTLTSAASSSARVCTARISARPLVSGKSICTMRSKRPGRISAGSRSDARLVAPTTITPLFDESSPSMHASSWLSVCSASSFEPANLNERRLPRASSSSMKTTHGAILAALTKSARSLLAPRPTKISTKSEPEQKKNGTPASAASTRASSVLPVPGGPASNMPEGSLTPADWYFLGFLSICTISTTSFLALAMPCTSSNESGAPSEPADARLPTPPLILRCWRICMNPSPKIQIMARMRVLPPSNLPGIAALNSTPLVASSPSREGAAYTGRAK